MAIACDDSVEVCERRTLEVVDRFEADPPPPKPFGWLDIWLVGPAIAKMFNILRNTTLEKLNVLFFGRGRNKCFEIF